jgi:hypothetical protein
MCKTMTALAKLQHHNGSCLYLAFVKAEEKAAAIGCAVRLVCAVAALHMVRQRALARFPFFVFPPLRAGLPLHVRRQRRHTS